MKASIRCWLMLVMMLICHCTLSAQTQVTEFTPGVTADGVTYALPATTFDFTVKVMCMKYSPGEYAQYAERYLDLRDVQQQPSATYLIDEIKMVSQGVPDTTKVYTVKLKDKSSAANVQLSASGLLLAINTTIPEPVKTAMVLPRPTSNKLNSKQYFTNEILAATSTAKMAELTAQEIYDIRENRNLLLKGQAESMPTDGQQLQLMLDQLAKQEAALLQLFTGWTDTTYTSHELSFFPTADVENKVLFRFSRHYGLVDADDLSGEPFYLRVKDQKTVTFPSEKEAAKKKIQGVVYNLPSMAKVEVYNGDATLISKDMPIAQFGSKDELSPVLFNKGGAAKVTFSPSTGAVVKVEQ